MFNDFLFKNQSKCVDLLIFPEYFNPYPADCNYCAFIMFAQNWHKKFQWCFKTVANIGKTNTNYVPIIR